LLAGLREEKDTFSVCHKYLLTANILSGIVRLRIKERKATAAGGLNAEL
jgi:hypothetical protein